MNKKLTADQAQAVIWRVAAGEFQKVLAAELKVSPGTISLIISGKTWPELERPEVREVTRRGCKLKPEDIPIILTRLAARETNKAIAADYKVLPITIANIAKGRTWGHIPRPAPPTRRRKVWEG